MLDSRRAASTPSFEVLNKHDSAELVSALEHLLPQDGLLLAYGNFNDESALVRDSHKAAGDGSNYQPGLWPLTLSTYNIMQACKRLKIAHDIKHNTAHMQTLGPAQKQRLSKCTLQDVHRHFVESAGRRFLQQTPEGNSQVDCSCCAAYRNTNHCVA